MIARLPVGLRAFGLVLPLMLFCGLFFLWPLAAILGQAVTDPAVGAVLPRTVSALSDWDRTGDAPEAVRAALVEDLRAADDDLAVGDVVRRLNTEQSGFRTLMSKTISAVRAGEGPVDLVEVDKRWGQPAFWQAIARAAPPYTDRNLLAALDLRRDAGGAIAAAPDGSSANVPIMLRTLQIAGTVALACTLLGVPLAMLIASLEGWARHLLLAAVLLPLWTSLLVRTAAWYILLQDSGLINMALGRIGLGPVPLIFNRLGVVVAMTHVLLPFMVLPVYSVLLSIPKNMVPAALSLGASPIRAFVRVLLPLAMRGIASGVLLVFMSAIGYYITPALIGGAQDQMISSVIAFYALGTANWAMAASLGLVLLVVTLMLYAVYGRLSADRAGG